MSICKPENWSSKTTTESGKGLPKPAGPPLLEKPLIRPPEPPPREQKTNQDGPCWQSVHSHASSANHVPGYGYRVFHDAKSMTAIGSAANELSWVCTVTHNMGLKRSLQGLARADKTRRNVVTKAKTTVMPKLSYLDTSCHLLANLRICQVEVCYSSRRMKLWLYLPISSSPRLTSYWHRSLRSPCNARYRWKAGRHWPKEVMETPYAKESARAQCCLQRREWSVRGATLWCLAKSFAECCRHSAKTFIGNACAECCHRVWEAFGRIGGNKSKIRRRNKWRSHS